MPTNTFGPNDKYDTNNSHFLPALIKKVAQAKKRKKKVIQLWGDGTAKREMIYVEDLADACVYFMKKKTRENLINIGTGVDYTIKNYLRMLLKINYPKNNVKIIYDKTKPNGTPRKVLDISLAKKYGWKAKTNLNIALKKTFLDFEKNYI